MFNSNRKRCRLCNKLDSKSNLKLLLSIYYHGSCIKAMKIKPGDYVLVNGEANEAFFVMAVEEKRILLTTGLWEPIEKCRKIPKRLHKHLYEIIKCYMDEKGMDKMPV